MADLCSNWPFCSNDLIISSEHKKSRWWCMNSIINWKILRKNQEGSIQRPPIPKIKVKIKQELGEVLELLGLMLLLCIFIHQKLCCYFNFYSFELFMTIKRRFPVWQRKVSGTTNKEIQLKQNKTYLTFLHCSTLSHHL